MIYLAEMDFQSFLLFFQQSAIRNLLSKLSKTIGNPPLESQKTRVSQEAFQFKLFETWRGNTNYPIINYIIWLSKFTVWKFQNFSAIQIFRETIFEVSNRSKTAIFEVSEALNLTFSKLQASKIAKNHQILTSEPQKYEKCQFLHLLGIPKIDFT